MIGMVLAAGAGKRLGHETAELPKTLLPVDGDRTILDVALGNFATVGLERAVIVTGYAHERLAERARRGPVVAEHAREVGCRGHAHRIARRIRPLCVYAIAKPPQASSAMNVTRGVKRAAVMEMTAKRSPIGKAAMRFSHRTTRTSSSRAHSDSTRAANVRRRGGGAVVARRASAVAPA